jgi:hypothetical protein
MADKGKAMLGDDLMQVKRRGEPVNIVLARTQVVGGKVTLKVEAPPKLRAAPGAKVLVKHVYRLQEGSTEREEYRILLRSRLNGKEHAPSLARFGDNYAMPDDYSGYLVHEYVLPTSGKVLLSFEVAAEYTIGSWKTEHVDSHEVRRGEGDIEIQL